MYYLNFGNRECLICYRLSIEFGIKLTKLNICLIPERRRLPYSNSISEEAKRFMIECSKQGSVHHCSIGVGHIADKIEKL